MNDKVVSLAAVRSERRDEKRVRMFCCIVCNCYSFKLIEIEGEGISLACANCEAWIVEFDVTANRPVD